MKTGVELTTLAIIIHCTVLLPSFTFAGNETQDLLDMMRYLETRSAIDEQKLFRPTPQEREAVSKLLDMKPRPKTFNEADIRYLKGLLDKAAWLGADQRIVHQMWTEVTGKEWGTSDVDSSKQPERMR